MLEAEGSPQLVPWVSIYEGRGRDQASLLSGGLLVGLLAEGICRNGQVY